MKKALAVLWYIMAVFVMAYGLAVLITATSKPEQILSGTVIAGGVVLALLPTIYRNI